jgi:preprotein translocase subunit SecB
VTYSEQHLRASRVGAIASLLDLRLRSVRAEVINPLALPPFSVGVDVHPTVVREESEDVVLFNLEYALTATAGEDAGEVLRIEAVFGLAYELKTDQEVSAEDLLAFGDVSVTFAAHPYFREFVQSLTTRFGLPPLTLDVVRSPLDIAAKDASDAGFPSLLPHDGHAAIEGGPSAKGTEH